MMESFLFFSFFYSFEAPDSRKPGSGASVFSVSQEKDKPKEDDPVLCGSCLERITAEKNMTERGGVWEHTFTNAHGYVFRVGCFDQAPGCTVAGEPTGDFTWFQGYDWQFCLCRNCMNHLGWYYNSGEDSFYGLIVTELLFRRS